MNRRVGKEAIKVQNVNVPLPRKVTTMTNMIMMDQSSILFKFSHIVFPHDQSMVVTCHYMETVDFVHSYWPFSFYIYCSFSTVRVISSIFV